MLISVYKLMFHSMPGELDNKLFPYRCTCHEKGHRGGQMGAMQSSTRISCGSILAIIISKICQLDH